ncbi:lysine transporter LysE [Flavobacterium humi]|uniref:Lysine transporter LysE n=1 Tax=Flavobacterium humi TaxID=2562683 RepID=A0A4Z0L7M9_9FLAO|nr:lysine transporter LysE [Flavobacterium humi]TGD58424.1 lysine transporter LysE [Flavobacterium humi]
MGFILPLFLGFITATIGIFPPGLINMTAAKISVQDGKTRAMLFTSGALVVIFFQTLLALVFARYIDAHQEVVILLREIGFGIFSVLTLYFFFLAKGPKKQVKEEIKIKSKKSRFFLGMLISAINFFPIPYYVFVSVGLASFGYFSFHSAAIYTFVIGVVFGSFAVFYAYIAFFKKIESKTDFIIRNMNTIIGSITGLVSALTLYNIIKYYFKF